MAAPNKIPNRRYEDVAELKDIDGVVAVITRARNGALAVAFFKEFDPGDGEAQRTAFVREKQLAAIERLIPLVRNEMARLRSGESD